MMLVHSPSLTKTIGDWVGARTALSGEVSFTGNYNAIAVVHDEALVAGFIYHDWHPAYKTIQMTLAAHSPRWASRRIIEGLLRYPFLELGVQRITVLVREKNVNSIRLAEGVGFKREAVIERGAGDSENIIVLRLFIEEWRAGKFYKGIDHGQAISAKAA